MEATVEYESLFQWIPGFSGDELALPIEAEVLDGSGLGYLKINTFSDDYNLMAQLWDRYMRELIDWDVPGIIIDLRVNGGGNSGLAFDFAGYFFDEEIELMQSSYYNELSGTFEYRDFTSRIMPGTIHYDGPLAVLVSPYCVSACEGFSYSLTLREDVTVLGHTPSAGAYGEVGRGQYDMPADLSMQFPTGRSETMDGDLLIEGKGVIPDILVPFTQEDALGLDDNVLDAAIDVLLD
jgi:carboxyl-terminal processing protease